METFMCSVSLRGFAHYQLLHLLLTELLVRNPLTTCSEKGIKTFWLQTLHPRLPIHISSCVHHLQAVGLVAFGS